MLARHEPISQLCYDQGLVEVFPLVALVVTSLQNVRSDLYRFVVMLTVEFGIGNSKAFQVNDVRNSHHWGSEATDYLSHG
jgi:hypothetical protein